METEGIMRNAVAKDLGSAKYRPRVVASKKAYNRKKVAKKACTND
jgi:hypothetical protein